MARESVLPSASSFQRKRATLLEFRIGKTLIQKLHRIGNRHPAPMQLHQSLEKIQPNGLALGSKLAGTGLGWIVFLPKGMDDTDLLFFSLPPTLVTLRGVMPSARINCFAFFRSSASTSPARLFPLGQWLRI